jgi:hypothetical protein
VLRRTLLAFGWLLGALAISFGGAGIVATLDNLPAGGGRPELSWAADRAVAEDLDAAAAGLAALEDAVALLGDHGRTALAALVARDSERLGAAIEAGTTQLGLIDAAARQFEAPLAAVPLDAPDRAMRFSVAVLVRHDALAAASGATARLRPAWQRLVAGLAPATALSSHLLAHDQIAGEAVRLGGAGEYRTAIARLDEAVVELEAARAIRDQLAATVDVTTLDDWLDRTEDYRFALRDLWDALLRARGLVTGEVREAAARERAARAMLPPDARALVVILGDVARGGLNQAVIEIEEVRAVLLDALEAADGAGHRATRSVGELPGPPRNQSAAERGGCRATPGACDGRRCGGRPAGAGPDRLPRVPPSAAGARWAANLEPSAECRCMSSPISPGTWQPMSWPSRPLPRPPSTVLWASSIAGPPESCVRWPPSAS